MQHEHTDVWNLIAATICATVLGAAALIIAMICFAFIHFAWVSTDPVRQLICGWMAFELTLRTGAWTWMTAKAVLAMFTTTKPASEPVLLRP